MENVLRDVSVLCWWDPLELEWQVKMYTIGILGVTIDGVNWGSSWHVFKRAILKQTDLISN